MGNIFIKTVIIYFLLLIAVRLMGKKEIGQMQPVELVAIIIIADVASVPMQNIGTPLIQGIVPVFAILIVELLLSYLNIKFQFFHKLISGKPSILIAKGQIIEKNLKKQRYSIDGLLEQIRIVGYQDINDVDYAILETSGQISVIPKTDKMCVTRGDLNIKASYVGYPRIIIMEGNIYLENLYLLGLDERWLEKKLKEKNLLKDEIFIFVVDESKQIFFQKKERYYMKDLIVSLVILIFVFGGDFIINSYLASSGEELIKEVGALENKSLLSIEEKKELVDKLKSSWEEKKKIWIIFEYHEIIEILEEDMIAIYNYFLNDNMEEYAKFYDDLKREVKGLQTAWKINYVNIF